MTKSMNDIIRHLPLEYLNNQSVNDLIDLTSELSVENEMLNKNRVVEAPEKSWF